MSNYSSVADNQGDILLVRLHTDDTINSNYLENSAHYFSSTEQVILNT
jgi:hypothetical protein